MDCSVIIPVRNEHPRLAFTVDSILQEFKRCNLDAEILLVFNGNTDNGYDWVSKRFGKKSKYKLIVNDREGQCQARQRGVEESKSDTLIFFDAHILVEPFSIKTILESFQNTNEKLGAGFFPIRYILDVNHIAYGYKLNNTCFWGVWTHKKYHDVPYHMPQSGAAGFVLKKDVFINCGGYNKHLGIYGGGEPYLFYKLEMMGYTNFIVPDTCVAHLADHRGYSWNNDILWGNFLLAAYTLGGQDFSNIYYERYKERCNGVSRYLEKLDSIYTEVIQKGEEDRLFIEAHKVKSIQDVCSESNYDHRIIQYE